MNNPYLSLDRKYFETSLTGQYAVTGDDLRRIPNLRKLFDISYLKDDKIVFDDFTEDEKLKIGEVIFEHYQYIYWIGFEKYIDFQKIITKSNNENLKYEISKLDPKYFYKSPVSPSEYIYLYEKLPKSTFSLLVKIYFYSKFNTETTKDVYLNQTDTLTDVDLNLYKYNKKENNTEFIAEIFNNWIRTSTNTIPFAPGYGNRLKELIQEKNNKVKASILKTTIVNFFEELKYQYESILNIDDVVISLIGDRSLEIKIHLTIDNNKTVFNLNA